MVSNYLEDPAHNDIEDIEGDSPEIIALRKEMVDMAAAEDEEPGADPRQSKINSSVILNPGHSKSIEMDYFYTAIPQTRFS